MSKQQHKQCYDGYTSLPNIRRCLREGHPVMLLMRGVPGSGKSYFASNLAEEFRDSIIFSTDDFFTTEEHISQRYRFEEYDKKNVLKVRDAMINDRKPIIVDSGNIQGIHMTQYILHAVKYFYEIYIVEPDNTWKYNAEECAKRNLHGFSHENIIKLLDLLRKEGKPALSCLIGSEKQLRLEPPLDDDNDANSEPHIFMPSDYYKQNIFMETSSKPSSINQLLLVQDEKNYNEMTSPLDCELKFSHTSALFSMIPSTRPNMKEVVVREISTQTSDIIVTLNCSGLFCEIVDVIEGPTMTIEKSLTSNTKMKDRVVRMDNPPQVSEMDVLVAIFPEIQFSQLSHYYQMLGLEETVRLFVEIGAFVDWSGQVDEESFIENAAASEMSATIYDEESGRGNLDVWDEIINRTCKDDFDHSSDISDTTLNIDNLTDTSSALIDISLSEDMCKKMNILFGENQQTLSKNAQIPVWLLQQLYLAWQGVEIYPLQTYQKRFPLNDVTQSDEELARCLQEEMFKQANKDIKMDVAQNLQLKQLICEFPNVDPVRIEEIFAENRYNSENTKSTLKMMLETTDDADDRLSIDTKPITKLNPATVVSPQPRFTNFSTAQDRAIVYQKQAEELAAKRHMEVRKAERYHRKHGMAAAGFVSLQNAQGHAIRERELREQAANILKEANANSNYLDLHLLTQKDAMAILTEKLSLLDRPKNVRNGRSSKRLRVITGYGKSSNGRAVIKPAVEAYLKNNNYSYWFSNMGEILIQCK